MQRELECLREQHAHELELKRMELQFQRTAVTTNAPSTVRVYNFRVVDAARMVPKFDPSDRKLSVVI